MSAHLITQLIAYGEELLVTGESSPPDMILQVTLKETKSSEFLKLEKATLTYKELKYFKDNLEQIPDALKKNKGNTIDFALLASIYTLKYLGGHYVQKIDLMIKLLAKTYNVEDQMFKTQVNL